jgi:hypothetical protein
VDDAYGEYYPMAAGFEAEAADELEGKKGAAAAGKRRKEWGHIYAGDDDTPFYPRSGEENRKAWEQKSILLCSSIESGNLRSVLQTAVHTKQRQLHLSKPFSPSPSSVTPISHPPVVFVNCPPVQEAQKCQIYGSFSTTLYECTLTHAYTYTRTHTCTHIQTCTHIREQLQLRRVHLPRVGRPTRPRLTPGFTHRSCIRSYRRLRTS